MPALRSLEPEFPVLDAAFRRFCSPRGLFTVEDFLICDLHALAAAADREPNSAALREGIASVLSVIYGQHHPWRNGTELLDDAVQSKRFLASGCHEVDLLLEGGLREGQVTEVVGASSSGKTQMCLCIAAHVAQRYSGTVMYIDTGNSFSAKRIASAVDFMCGKNEMKEYKRQRTMNKIFHRSVFDIFSLLEILRELELTLAYDTDSRPCLLIIDSISSLVTPILGSKNSHGLDSQESDFAVAATTRDHLRANTCFHDLLVICHTSWAKENCRQCFLRCRRSFNKGADCGFFVWIHLHVAVHIKQKMLQMGMEAVKTESLPRTKKDECTMMNMKVQFLEQELEQKEIDFCKLDIELEFKAEKAVELECTWWPS